MKNETRNKVNQTNDKSKADKLFPVDINFLFHMVAKIQKKIGCRHDNRFSKTNYLKTNLLKQIKKISLVGKFRYFLYLLHCKDKCFKNNHKTFLQKKCSTYYKNNKKGTDL